jgi:hypothetical protein
MSTAASLYTSSRFVRAFQYWEKISNDVFTKTVVSSASKS